MAWSMTIRRDPEPGPPCRCDRGYHEDGRWYIQIRLRCYHFEQVPQEVQDNIRKLERELGWL